MKRVANSPLPKFRFRCLLFLCVVGASSSLYGAPPSEYILTNITGWTPAQLATLPHFDRYVPVAPAGASGDFVPVSANGLGLTSGNYSAQFTTADDGAVVEAGSQTAIGAWGTWYWSYWRWDGHDYHYESGTVNRSPARAANVLGQVAGYANLGGGSSEFATRNDWKDHIYIYDPATGQKTDLTPTANRCDVGDLNDRSEITGYWSDDSNSHPFRRSADGTFTDFVFNEPFSHYINPRVINNHGHVAGMVTVWTTPRDYIPWISESGSSTVALPYPDTNNAYNASIADINDHDVIVGHFYKADTPLETIAIRWTKQGGNWVAEELIELLEDNFDFILDRALAVNDAGHIICSGHADGGPDDTWNTHRFLLTPDVFAPPAVTTLPPANVTSNSASLRAKISPGNLSTTWNFEYGAPVTYGNTTAPANATGTLPTLGEATLTGLQPYTTYHFRAGGTNSEGSTDSMDAAFTTAWDWPNWAAAYLGSPAADPQGDANANGVPDLIDYGTGNALAPAITTNASQLEMTFRHSLIADGVTLVVQVSDDLVHWDNGSSYGYSGSTPSNAFSTELSRIADGLDGEIITVGVDASPARRFVRLVAVSP